MRRARIGWMLLGCVLAAALVGCASAGAGSAGHPARKAGKASVYFYSMPGWVSPENPVWILEGLTLVAVLQADSYSIAYLPPGEHWLHSWKPTSPPESYERDCFEFPEDRPSYVRLERDGSMTLLATDADLRHLLDAYPDLPLHQVSPDLADIARKRVAGFAAAGPDTETTEPAEPPAASEAEGLLVPSGTSVSLRLVENVNSYNTKPGEPVLFAVEEDVIVGSLVVVPAGLLVEGTAEQVYRPGRFGTPGIVVIDLLKVVLPTGEKIPLKGYLSSAGRPSGAANTLGTIASGGLTEGVNNLDPYALGLAFIMVLVMTQVHGHDAWVGAGTQAIAYVRADTRVNFGGRLAPPEAVSPTGGTEISASSMEPIVVPLSARVTSQWGVRLDTPAPPSRIWITSVADLSPPRDVEASKIVSHGTWQEVRFPAWPVVRFAVLGPSGPATIPVLLEGTFADGTAFFATVQATVSVEPAH